MCSLHRKEDQIQLLETEMDQERRMADNLVNDMVSDANVSGIISTLGVGDIVSIPKVGDVASIPDDSMISC